GRVREQRGLRAQQQPEPGGGAGADVAADVIGVAGGEFGGSGGGAGEDAVAEPGGVALQLAFDGVGEVAGPAVRHVAVGPEDVAALGGAGGIGDAGLDGDEERGVGSTVLACGGAQRGADLG